MRHLGDCPCLSELFIKTIALSTNMTFSASRQALPRLRVLQCPPLLASILVPGRPVEELLLTSPLYGDPDTENWRPSNEEDSLLGLTATTSKITKLVVPSEVFLVAPHGLSHHFPRLKDLILLGTNDQTLRAVSGRARLPVFLSSCS